MGPVHKDRPFLCNRVGLVSDWALGVSLEQTQNLVFLFAACLRMLRPDVGLTT